MSDGGSPGPLRRGVRLLVRASALVLILHFVWVLPLTSKIPLSSVSVFVLALLLVAPGVGARLPLRGVRFVLAIGLLFVANVWLAHGGTHDLERPPRAYVGATILDGRADGAAVESGVVLVGADGRIEAVGSAGQVDVPDGYERVDLTGRYLMPGLLNAHGHLLLSGRPAGAPIELELFAMPDWMMAIGSWFMDTDPGRHIVLWQMERNAQLALASGVTTLRGLGDPGFLDVELRDRIEDGRAIGPTLLASGPLLCTTGGHGHQIAQVVDGPVEARRAVRNALARRVDHIKIANTGGVSDSRRIGEAGELQLTPEEIAAIVDEAHRKHVLVAAHAESTEGVLEALRAGVDSIEHGARLTPEALALFRENPNALRGHTTLHATLSVVGDEIAVSDDIRANPALFVMVTNANTIRGEVLEGFRQAVAAGVPFAVGTDAGIVSHGDVWMEMKHFVEVGGLSNAEALHHGTLGTARSIGVDAETGSIEAGKWADLLVVDDDPREDLATLAAPRLVVSRGRIASPGRPR